MVDEVIVFSALQCSGCPASIIRDQHIEHIKHYEELRLQQLKAISEIKAFILAESPPAKGFFYDLSSASRLRNNIQKELGIESSEKLLEFLKSKGILLVDCALCPLHKLSKKSARRQAASLCLEKHTKKYLNLSPNTPIITIFPTRLGLLKRSPAYKEISNRIVASYNFNKIKGLKELLEKLLNKG